MYLKIFMTDIKSNRYIKAFLPAYNFFKWIQNAFHLIARPVIRAVLVRRRI